MPCDYSTVEVKQLWWFIDGAIMSPFVRHRLWDSWGFCPRHTWAYLIAECELRLMPRGALVLYEDLAARAESALEARRWPSRFRTTDVCLTCDYLNIGDRDRTETGWIEETGRVNRQVRTAQLVGLDRERWQPRSCPQCLGGSGPLCMSHLMAAHDRGNSIGGAERKATVAALRNARRRMQTTLNAICWPRKPVQPGGWAGLIEVLGWFGGWQGLAEVPAPQAVHDPDHVELLYTGAGLAR